MESAEREKAAIISGIEADANAEVQGIVKEAQRQAAEKIKYFDDKVKSLLEDAQKQAGQQAETVNKKMISGIKLEMKRSLMRVQQAVIEEIMGKVERKFQSMIDSEGYRAILADWITEASIGLGAESALINASEKERTLIDEKLIRDVTEKVLAETGRKVTLQLTSEAPLKLQGVVLTAVDGRTAFNNQLRTRIARKERDIQLMIYKSLFADGRKESL
jgi:vacuolar-type H+-ATPase subunit E/Vma4